MATSTRGEGFEDEEGLAQRLDKWLWFARLVKSRTGAAELIANGKVRVNRVRAIKPSQSVRPGDVLTVALRGKVRIIKVLSAARRRGPPQEAQQLYQLIETRGPEGQPASEHAPDAGRPGKRVRRFLQRLADK